MRTKIGTPGRPPASAPALVCEASISTTPRRARVPVQIRRPVRGRLAGAVLADGGGAPAKGGLDSKSGAAIDFTGIGSTLGAAGSGAAATWVGLLRLGSTSVLRGAVSAFGAGAASGISARSVGA